MEITPEEIENYQEDIRNFTDNSFDKKETRKLIEKEWWWKWLTRQMTQDKVQILEQAFMNDFSVEEACHQAGIPVSLFVNYYNNNLEFKDRINSARDFPFRLWKKKIMEAVASKDFNDYEFILKWLRQRQPQWYWDTPQFQEHNEALTQEDDELLKQILIDKWDERTLDEIKKQEQLEQESEFSRQIDSFLTNTDTPDAFGWTEDAGL